MTTPATIAREAMSLARKYGWDRYAVTRAGIEALRAQGYTQKQAAEIVAGIDDMRTIKSTAAGIIRAAFQRRYCVADILAFAIFAQSVRDSGVTIFNALAFLFAASIIEVIRHKIGADK